MAGPDGLSPEQRARLMEAVLVHTNDAVMMTEATPLDEPGPRILYVNEAFTRMTGYGPEEAAGRSPRFLQGPDTDRRETARIRAALERGEPVRAELLNHRKDGSPFWVELDIVPVQDEGGALTHWISVQRETTARRQMEDALQASKEALEALVRATPLAIVTIDPEGNVERWNPAAERLFGWTRDEVLGGPLPVIPPEELETHLGIRTRALAGEAFTGMPVVRQRKDGRRIPIRLSAAPIRDRQGRIRGVIAVLEDITEQRRAEEALRASEERFRRAVMSAPFPIMIHDEDGRVVQVNDVWTELTGYAPDELRTVADWTARAYGERAAAVERHFRDLHHLTHKLAEGEYEIRTRGGETRIWDFSSAPLGRGAEGRHQVISMAMDVTERRRAQAALRESEARFRVIFERAVLGIGLVNEDGRFLATNPALQRMLGYSADELRDMPFTEVTHPDDVHADWARFRELQEGRLEGYELTKRYICKDGRVIWGRLQLSAVPNAGGRFRYAVGLVEDVTARREAEETERRLVAILEATPDLVAIADAEGRVLFINRAGRRLLGLSLEQARGRALIDLHARWAGALLVREAIPTAARRGSWRGESAVVDRHGREVPVSEVLQAHPGTEGPVEYLSVVVRDMSERQRTEEMLRFLSDASRLLSTSLDYADVIESIARLVVPRWADYCVVDLIEDEGVQRTALVHTEPDGQRLLDRLRAFPPAEDRPVGPAHVLATGIPELVRHVSTAWMRAASVDDAHFDLLRALDPRSVVVVPLSVRDRTIGVAMLARVHPDRPYDQRDLRLATDLAGRAALAIENARLYREALEATRTRDEVLRLVAHDLRRPVTSISLAATLLAEELPPAIERDGLQVILRATERANRLIRDLLDVARMEAGRLGIEPVSLAPGGLIGEAVALHFPFSERAQIRLEQEIPEELPDVRADRDRVLQVLGNLLDNAVRFTPPGGKVVVRAEPADAMVRFSVTDSGPGMPPDQVDRLFEPFWQARRGAGTGLGLTIAKGIVEAHGGRIGAESRPGAGTTVWFTLPVA